MKFKKDKPPKPDAEKTELELLEDACIASGFNLHKSKVGFIMEVNVRTGEISIETTLIVNKINQNKLKDILVAQGFTR